MDDSTYTEFNDLQRTAPAAQLKSWGSFQLKEKVGQGAFGEVYRAFDTTLEREVALKLLLPRGQDAAAESRTVLREARLMAKVRHPHVVSVYGVDAHEGRVGLWSDFVRGKTLSALLAAQGPFGPKEAANIGIDLAKAVGAVHAAGLLHRDIKTGNAMREEGGRILLMDFGLTHEKDSAAGWAGTPAYMAPEILAGQPASVTTDIYALGVVLFHLLTARYPYERSTTTPDSMKGGQHRLRLLDARPDLPEPLACVIEKATDEVPSKRFQSTGELIAAISEAAAVPVSRDLEQSAQQPSRFRLWMLAPVALAAVGLYFLKSPDKPPAAVTAKATQAYDLLKHYYKGDDTEQAVAILTSIEKRTGPMDAALARAYYLQYRQLRDTKLKAPIIEAANEAIAKNPKLPSPYVTLGMLYTLTGENDEATSNIDKAIEIDPRGNAEAYWARGELAIKMGHHKDAEADLLKAYQLAPEDWRFADLLGYFYERTGDVKKELEYGERAFELAPDNPRVLNNIGRLYMRLGQLDKAKVALEKAIKIEPTGRSASNRYTNLAITLEQQGKLDESVQYFKKAIEVNDQSYLAWGDLALVYLLQPGRKADAREAFQKAIALVDDIRKQRSKDELLLIYLSNYHAGLGNESKSLPYLRQAVLLAPDDPGILFYAALTYELLNRRHDALNSLQKSLERGWPLAFVQNQPEFKSLQTDLRFQQIRKPFVR